MMEEEQKDNKNLYQCKECGLHYQDKDISEKCEAWCKEHKSCNVEIIKQAEENKIQELGKKCEEYLDGWKRERADFLNYKKDEMERIGFLVKYANEETILKILPILDNIYLSEKQLPENLKNGEKGSPQAIEWTKGFLQIKKQLSEFLKKEGIEEIKTMGEKFDPNTMEIVEEGEDGESGMVKEELQKGYMMSGKVLRPAKVKVNK